MQNFWAQIGPFPQMRIFENQIFSQGCSFCRMLMNQKNFHFTQIPGKTNDIIFLKSPKTKNHVFEPFLTIFARWGFFPKNPALSHTTIYGPLTTMLTKFQKKTNESIPRKLTDLFSELARKNDCKRENILSCHIWNFT